MSHEEPGLVEITATGKTSWRGELKGINDLTRGKAVEVKARFDGRHWVAERVKEWRLKATDPCGAPFPE